MSFPETSFARLPLSYHAKYINESLKSPNTAEIVSISPLVSKKTRTLKYFLLLLLLTLLATIFN